MPLAILLAAAWAETLAPAEIAAQVAAQLPGQGLDFLEGDLRDVPERQRSVRAVFDRSWRLLSERERQVFARLSVFRGAFTSEAAGAVAGADLRTLRGLVRKSFLQLDPTGRYGVHELLRQYGEEHLAQDPGAARKARDRHSAYYTGAVERRAAAFKGPGQEAAWDEMAVEIDDVRGAWDWAAEEGCVDRVERAVEGLGMFCDWGGLVQEGAESFGRAAAALEPAASDDGLRVLAKLWAWQSNFATTQGRRSELTEKCLSLLHRPAFAVPDARRDRAFVLLKVGDTMSDHDPGRGRELCLRSLALYRELDDRWAIGQAQGLLALMAWVVGDYDQAEQRLEEKLDIARSLGDATQTCAATSWLARVAFMRGRAEACAHWAQEYAVLLRGQRNPMLVPDGINIRAIASVLAGQHAAGDAFYDACKAIYRERGYHLVSARMDAWQSSVKVHLGLYQEARPLARSGLRVGRETDTPEEVGLGLYGLGCVALAEGSYEQAQRQLQESLAAFRGYQGRAHTGQVLGALACAACRLGRHAQARQYICEALRTGVEIGSTLPALHALPAMALLLASEGQGERGVALYALASRHPYVANSRWFEDVVGRHVAAAAATLPAEVVAAAQERGRARDLEAAARELLAELGSHA
jgi:tetratricopeptide (TPR) repeat protein